MAKEFKMWDKAFSKVEIEDCRAEWLDGYKDSLQHARASEEALERMGYTAVSVQEARYAVYEAKGFRGWQLFRVAMKGLTTKEKIHMCMNRWNSVHNVYDDADLVTEKHRIWNYIGALKRGGQLVEDEFGNLIINK